jgi:acylpyruvate hydrolase
MRFANVEVDGLVRAARIEGEVANLLLAQSISAGFDFAALRESTSEKSVSTAEVRFLPPVIRPGKVICLGLNFKAHAEEAGRELPDYPVLFTKFTESIIGPYEGIVVPPESQMVDYEAELAVVIGKHARRVKAEDALDVIAGYTVANDVSMRDYQSKSHQWLQGKAWPRCTPLGPWFVTADELGDASGLEIRLELDGVELQHSTTDLMIFDVPTTIAALTEFVELQPGDVILMGTPSGVGFKREPPEYLTPGRRVRVEIERIGAIENVVVAEDVTDS